MRCNQQFSQDIIVLQNDNGTSLSKQNFQSSSMTFITFQDLYLWQELLEYMDVHDNDASESSQPSWGKSWEVNPTHAYYMAPKQVKTMKIQAGVQVSRLEELKRHL
ncbi:hypothetical protein Tco_1085679 [Tanacetum coccineum]